MAEEFGLLSGLYYPFSRCINVSSLKQLLLVFDKLVFLDPVDDEHWRAALYRELETTEDPRFQHYRSVFDSIPTLIHDGAISRLSPDECVSIQAPTTSAAAISDLLDPQWTTQASNPSRYRMPHRSLATDGSATWQAFLPKLPKEFVNALQEDPLLHSHLVAQGDEHYSWTLSYAAGSASSLNVHLAVAEQYGLAPVTDSEMHHELLLLKLIRNQRDLTKPRPISDEVAGQLARKVAISILTNILPEQSISSISFDELLRFREATKAVRAQLIEDISSRISLLTRLPDPEDLAHAAHEIKQGISKELRSYQAEFGATRDKLWPALAASANTSLATGSLAAVAMSFIGGPGHVLAASIVAASLATLKATLDIRAEQKKLESSTSPAVSYLSKIANTFA